MKNIPKSFIVSLIVVGVFTLQSGTALAFPKDTVDRDSFSRPELGIGVFELTFPVGGWSKDLYIPVVGEQNLPYGSRIRKFGYTFERSGTTTDTATGTALILSNAEMVDGFYRIPAGTTAWLTVLAIASADEKDGDLYRMRVTELPFFLGDDRLPGHFTNGEMKYLTTNSEPLHYTRDPE